MTGREGVAGRDTGSAAADLEVTGGRRRVAAQFGPLIVVVVVADAAERRARDAVAVGRHRAPTVAPESAGRGG